MKRLTIFCLSILAAALLFPGHDYDARYLKISIFYEAHEDGSWDMTYEHQVRLNTYYAVNRALGETFITYNPDFQELKVLKSETTMADGRKVSSPENAFNEVLPFPAHGFPDFAGLREMVVTHTGLERGAVVDLKYRIHTKTGFLPVFSGCEILERSFPIDRYSLEIVVPAGNQFHFGTIGYGTDIKPETVEADSRKHYVFHFSDLPPADREPLAPNEIGPCILFSSSKDWEAALALKIKNNFLPECLKEEITEVKTRCLAHTDLLAELKKIAADEIRNCGLGIEMTGWQPRSLEKVFRGGYGTGLEKALLLKSTLKEADMDTELLAIAAGRELAAGVATPLQLGGFWLKVNAGPRSYYLDPCSEQQEFFSYMHQGCEAWNLERQVIEKLPVSDWEQNGVYVSGQVRLEKDEVSGILSVKVSGAFHQYGEAAADSGKFIEGVLKEFFPVGKVEIKKILILTRHEIRAEAAFTGKWIKEDDAGCFIIDECRLPGLAENMVILEDRKSSLEIDTPFKVSLRLDIKPTKDWKLDYICPKIKRENALGFFSRSLTLEKDGNIRFIEACGIGKRTVLPAEYPLLRALFLPYFVSDYWMVFTKGK